MLLRVVRSCRAKFETGQTFERNNVVSVCTAPPTFSGPRTRITHRLLLVTTSYGLYPSQDAIQVPTLLGVVASVCTPRQKGRNNLINWLFSTLVNETQSTTDKGNLCTGNKGGFSTRKRSK